MPVEYFAVRYPSVFFAGKLEEEGEPILAGGVVGFVGRFVGGIERFSRRP